MVDSVEFRASTGVYDPIRVYGHIAKVYSGFKYPFLCTIRVKRHDPGGETNIDCAVWSKNRLIQISRTTLIYPFLGPSKRNCIKFFRSIVNRVHCVRADNDWTKNGTAHAEEPFLRSVWIYGIQANRRFRHAMG